MKTRFFMKKIIALFLLTSSCGPFLVNAQKLTRFVDPFLGTGGHGHVYPGAVVPFGMVQLSPDNGDEGWDWCGGYHYSSKHIAGFSHTHLSGTGIGDWCDISVLPLSDTNELRQAKIKIPFSHQNETARPGYYSVKLDNGIRCELTANERTGFHKYRFPSATGWLRFDMGFAINWDKSTAGMLQLKDPYTLVGYRYSTGWAKGQKVYFAARFSAPVTNYLFVDDSTYRQNTGLGSEVKIALQFSTRNPLLVKVSLSSVSEEKALAELQKSAKKSFESTEASATRLWETELQKITIDTTNRQLSTRFYTAVYHTCLAPLISNDADGEYQTHDGKRLFFETGKNGSTGFSVEKLKLESFVKWKKE
jgi:predicted alpha-1,2-mannosidase